MADVEKLLDRWLQAGLLDAATADRLRAYESRQTRPGGLRWQVRVALILGAILLACGVALFVAAHWNRISPGARFALVLAMVALFHLAAGLVRSHFGSLSTVLHAVGTLSAGPAIALVGQIFNIQEHWPAAVLVWALAALAGWILLRDEAQQTLALLLIPAWMLSELSLRMDGHIGANVYLGRMVFTWAVLYLTFFLDSRRRVMRGIVFACAAFAAVAGIVAMLQGWVSWSDVQTFVPFSTRVWAWIGIAALPLLVAAFKGHKGLVPPAAAIAFAIALPWCYRTWTSTVDYGNGHSWTVTGTTPTLAAHTLVAVFAVFLCWWGLRQTSRELVNLGILGFAAAVIWFYFSDIFTEVSRALGLIGLGILFLAGGWLIEKARRRILARLEARDALDLQVTHKAAEEKP